MGFIVNILYFIIVIGVLVAVHEFGHFIAARMCGIRADVFSIGMGTRLFGWNKINGFTFGKLPTDFDGGGKTDYRLSLFPIGGYVKIAGMVDESFDTNFKDAEPQPWEFRSKNTLVKVFVLSAGVIMNIILAIVIFSGIFLTQGKTELVSNVIKKVSPASVGAEIGFKDGDRVTEINGRKILTWNELVENLTLKDFGNKLKITVIRNGNPVVLDADGSKIVKSIAKKTEFGLEPGGIFTYIEMVVNGKPAEKAGILRGDTIVRIDGTEIGAPLSMQNILKEHKSSPVFIEWKRGDKILSDSITTSDNGIIGVQLGSGPLAIRHYGFFESIGLGAKESFNSFMFILNSIKQIFKGNLSFKESIGGPIMIYDMTAQQAERGFGDFLQFMALLSISLAFMNILPIPALDGGHLIFAVVEGIIRKEVPVKVKLAFQQGGVIFLLIFMAIVLFNDITRLFH